MRFLDGYAKPSSHSNNGQPGERGDSASPRSLNRLLKSIHPTILSVKAELFGIEAELSKADSVLFSAEFKDVYSTNDKLASQHDSDKRLAETPCNSLPFRLSVDIENKTMSNSPIEIDYLSKEFPAHKQPIVVVDQARNSPAHRSGSRLPKEAKKVLKSWFLENVSNPYPK